jgi:hypothetical protein
MQNLTIAQWEQLTDYLENREEFLCKSGHSKEYLNCWSEFYESAPEIQKFFTRKMNVSCDCTALAAGRNKLARLPPQTTASS